MTEPGSEIRFDGPTHAIHGPDGNIYISDGYYNSRIAVFSQKGVFIRSWGSKGYAPGQFQNPHGLAFTAEGTLLVADRDNGRIQNFTTDGKYIGELKSKEIGRPWGVSVAGDGSIFIVDGGDQDEKNARSGVVKLDRHGNFISRFSSYGSGAGELDWGHAITVSEDGREVYVADLNNERIQKFISTDARGSDYRIVTGWPPIPEKIRAIGIDLRGNRLYVTQSYAGAPVMVIDPGSGMVLSELSGANYRKAHGVDIGESGDLLITDVDSDCVYMTDKTGKIILNIGGKK